MFKSIFQLEIDTEPNTIKDNAYLSKFKPTIS